MKKIALVTGSNKGIGFEICRQLAKNGIQVILSSRDEGKGIEACNILSKEGINVDYHRLDVTDESSIDEVAGFIRDKYGRLDILVNNAGIMIDSGSVFLADNVDLIMETMATNVYGPLRITQKLLPLMRKNNYGRIVNISSGMGQLNDMNGGYPGYRLSKVSINALTRIMADELKGTNILVNTMCPGWVKTDMGGRGAYRTPEQGADTAVWLAMLPDGSPGGKFFRDRQEIPW
jgi:NAD(P)-dependent dehydrogenase (short-subunit alcohol dehydrogenase family)